MTGRGEDMAPALAWGLPLVNDAGDRLIAAAGLARRHPDATVLATGGRGTPSPTGAGVAPERLIVEDRSRDTLENAALSRDLAAMERPGP